MTYLSALVLCLLFVVIYIAIVLVEIKKEITSIAWAVDRPRREIAVLKEELQLIEERTSEGRPYADDHERANFIIKKVQRWDWQEHKERK